MGNPFKAVGNAISSIGKAISGVVNAVVNAVSSIVNMIASPFMGLLGGMPDMPDSNAESQRQQGVLLQRSGSIESIPIIYGYRKVGGIVTFVETGSDNNQYLWVAYVMSEGCVEGLREVFIDDVQLDSKYIQQLNAGQNVAITDGKFANRVQMRWYPGVYFNNPSDSPVGENDLMTGAPSWKRSMCYNGMAVLFARFYWKKIETQADADSNPFSGGVPKVQASILGKRVASLATGSNQENYTYGGTGYVENYSTNPAEVILDYLRNPRYGKGLANTDIDWDSFRIARNKFAQVVEYSPGISGPILTTNYVVDTRQTLFQNIKLLLQGCRSYLPYVQGKYKLKVEDAGNPTNINSGEATIVATFTRDNLIGEISYAGIERSSKYNYVELTYVDPDQKFSNQNVAFPEDEATRQTYIAQDGGRENGLTVTFPTLTNRQMALDMARLLFNKSRYQESISFKATSEAFELEPGDCVRVQAGILNFGAVPWRIVNIKLNSDMSFDVSCVRNPDWIYPYVTANTPDLVLPPYLPYGGGTIIPSYGTGSGVGVGLVPPSSIVLPPGVTVPLNTLTNPPPSLLTTGTNNSSTAPYIPPLIDVSDFFSTRAVRQGDYVTFELEFKQPENSQYGDLSVWYKGIYDLHYKQFFFSPKPGAGQTIVLPIGPVGATAHSKYQIITRVRYLTGEYSTKITKIELAVPTDSYGIVGSDSPADYFEVVVPGWSLNLTPPPGERNNVWGTIQGTPLRTNGQLGTQVDPRGMYFILKQRLSSTEPPNPDICGAEILFKEHTDSYWSVARFQDLTVQAGGDYHIKIGGPADSSNYFGNVGDYDAYDFIFRVLYKDGTISSNQSRLSGGNYVIVTSGITTSTQTMAQYSPLDLVKTAITSRGPVVNELVEDFALTTIDQAAATGTLTDARDAKIGITYYYGKTGNFVPPDNSVIADWRGIKFSWRKIVYGQTTEFQSVTINNARDGYPLYATTSSPVTVDFTNASIDGISDYQWVFTPMMRYNGATIESRYSLVGRGAFQYSGTSTNPADYNAVSKLNFKQALTAEAFNKIQADPPPPPAVNTDTVIVQDWELVKMLASNNPAGFLYDPTYKHSPLFSGDKGMGRTIPIYHYRLKYSMAHIPNFKYVTVYRRNHNTTLNGLPSRWESTPVASTSTSTIILNLRGPAALFTQASGSAMYDASGKFLGYDSVIEQQPKFPNGVSYNDGYRYWDANPSASDEFLLVVKSGTGAGTTSTRAIYLTGANPTSDTVTKNYSLLTTNVQQLDFPGQFNSYNTTSSVLNVDSSSALVPNYRLVCYGQWNNPSLSSTGTVLNSVIFNGPAQITHIDWNQIK